MSANRLMATYRLLRCLNELRLENIDMPFLKVITIDHESAPDDPTIRTLHLRQIDQTVLYNRHWVACCEDDELKRVLKAHVCGDMARIDRARALTEKLQSEPQNFTAEDGQELVAILWKILPQAAI